MEPRSDIELVQEVRNGRRQAFTELMRRYQERVYWLARRIVGSHEDADDVVQETFVKAYLALGEFRGDSSFFTWIYRIAVNLSLNALRKRQVLNYLHESELLSRILPSTDDPGKRPGEHRSGIRARAGGSRRFRRSRKRFSSCGTLTK